MRWSLRYEPWVAAGLGAFFAVGLAGHLVPATRSWMLALTSWMLVLFGLAALLPVLLEADWRLWLWAAGVYLATFALETVGTATGRVFGPYTYGRTLGLQLFGVPLVIAFNWLLVILGALLAARRLVSGAWLSSLLAAGLAAGFDWVMEPTAIRLDYWTWQSVGIPLQNYLAWFLIALAASLSLALPRLVTRSRLPLYYGAIQLVFFGVLHLALRT